MNSIKQFVVLTAAALALALAGCDSSSNSNSSTPPVAVPPATVTDVVSVGVISGFGSVIVGGVEYNTDASTVVMDDAPGILADLKIGMVVSIHGTVDDNSGAATASDIKFVDDADGIITSIDRLNNSFVILGRTVLVDELTVFDNATFTTLAVGNVVQVSGLWRSQERIQATHIERKANSYTAGMDIEVKGVINSLNTALKQFSIGTQLCDYSSAMLELGGATLSDGLYVEVASTTALSNGDLILDRIRARDQDQDRDRLCDSDCDFELEGYITRFVSPTDFDIDGYPVSTTDATNYVNGSVDELALDARVAAEGTLDANDILMADTIVFRHAALVQIEADIESIDATSSSVTLLGINVATNEFTVFRDGSGMTMREFGLDDLAVGDRIEIRAYMDGSTLVATRLDRDDADDTVTLKALVETVSQPTLTLLGITVVSDQNTVFRNLGQDVTDADSFFAAVMMDSVVKAEGTYNGSSILASQLYLRDCDNSCL